MTHYDVIREMGVGSFSTVFLVRERILQQERVCKQVSTHGLHPGVLKWLKMEIDLLCHLDHPHIVKLYEYSEDVKKDRLVLILEHLAGETCGEVLESHGPMAEALVARIIRQSLTALAYCHSRGVMHRDIKPENIILTKPLDRDQPDCKLIDFGLAAYAGGTSLRNYFGPLPHHSSCVAGMEYKGDFVGTPPYMAPEVVRREARDFSMADMWSIGVSAIEMVTGQCPFGRLSDFAMMAEPIYDRIQHYSQFQEVDARLKQNPVWDRCSPEFKDFVKGLLAADPERRPTAVDALVHPWLELHREAPASLTVEMMRSMKDYSNAHPLLRACLLIVLARSYEPSKAERVGHAFTCMDSDWDGEVTCEDIMRALDTETGWFVPEINVDTLIMAADVDDTAGLSYTEFAAACLWSRQTSVQALMRDAFYALDQDRDGLVAYQDIVKAFREDDLPYFRFLPDVLSLDDWVNCIESCVEGNVSGPGSLWSCSRGGEPKSCGTGFFDWFFYKCSPTVRI